MKWLKGMLCTMLLAVSTGCTPQPEVGVVEECLRKALHFRFDDTAASVPSCMVSLLGNKKVVLLGEIHYVKEHGCFASRLLERLHQEGFRYYLQEIGTAEGAVIDAYIRGEPVEIREDYFAYDREMITHLAMLNAQLRRQGRADEQFRYAGIDLHDPTMYEESVRRLCALYTGRSFAAHLPATAVLEQADADLHTDERALLHTLAEAERASLEIRADWCNEKREAFIEQQVLAILTQAKQNERILVNTGIFHAQLCPEWTIDEDADFEWLAMRLKKRLGTEEVYTIGVNVLEGELLKSWHRKETQRYGAQTDCEHGQDLISALGRAYPGETVFLDFRAIQSPPEEVPVQNPFRNTCIPLREQFDGMLIYPAVTPVHNPLVE